MSTRHELYPFDRHNCTIKLSSIDYTVDELSLTPTSSSTTLSLDDISQWEVIGFYKYNGTTLLSSVVVFGVNFQRKPEFIIVNLLPPIILLCFLNLAVFFLPPQSGERVSFSVTMFLSFSVYMTLITEKLPITNPVSIFTKYRMCNVGYSALILFTTVIGLRLHMSESNERIPVWLEKIICSRSNAKMNGYNIDPKSCNAPNVPNARSSCVDTVKKLQIEDGAVLVTLKDIGIMLDKVFFGFFLSVLVAANIVYTVYIASS
ncbi:acetylcholine receptor subunit alpha-like [Argopecten irradians]|uniref:acetylcholine receptor subunit alpha-like n=1 Tax=Argopecten irradians TaxID=31199 RepID=UPI00371C5DE4